MRLCFFLGKVGDYNVSFVETRMCRSTISSIIVFFITAVIFFMLFAFINDIHKMKINIAMIEDVMH